MDIREIFIMDTWNSKKMLYPFSEELCKECVVHRSRHYYLSLCKNYRGYISQPNKNAKLGVDYYPIDFEALKIGAKPWTNTHNQEGSKLEITLKSIDMETSETRACNPVEAKMYNWDNQKMRRLVDGSRQVASWVELNDVLEYRARKGYREVKICEGPHFMIIGGG